MKIASRPAREVHRDFTSIYNETPLSKDCGELSERIRRVSESSEQVSTVVFRCCGVPGKAHSPETRYAYYVELSPEELIAGLASLSPEQVESAVGKVLKTIEIAKLEEWAPVTTGGLNPKDRGCPVPSDLLSLSHAMERGIIAYLLQNVVTLDK